jgi:hypothetical protein
MAARDSYQKVSESLISNQREITQVIAKMSNIELMNGGLTSTCSYTFSKYRDLIISSEMLPVLKNAVQEFTSAYEYYGGLLSRLFN